jgi:predicted MFS family arabinose efflux permease
LFNVARAIGPALAALLLGIGTHGPLWCFLINAASYLAVIIALAGIRVAGTPPAQLKPQFADTPSGFSKRFLGGFHALAIAPGHLTLALLAGLVAMGGWPLMALLPSLASGLGQAEGGYGTLVSAVGIGALAAALTSATFGSEIRPKVLLLGGLILVAAGLIGLWASSSLPISTACCVLFGYGMILFFVTGQSVVQLGTSDADRGKVMGIWAMMLSAGVPLGNLVLGPAADLEFIGVKGVIAIQAGAISVSAMILTLRRLE